jgi:hypothetical protein
MRSVLATVITVCVLGFLAGCATTPSATVKSKNPPAKSSPSGTKANATAPKAPEEAPLAAGEYRLQIESTPSDAMVVVNGIPVGRTPRTIELAGTKHGFFRDQVSLKVRFISTDAAHPSQTVEELLTQLDKIPAVVKFTPSGATRISRKTS